MLEEEARLVHKHVRLTGKIARLEERILLILSTKTRRIFDRSGYAYCFQCPTCLQSCDNIMNLRNHLKIQHYPQLQSRIPWNVQQVHVDDDDVNNDGGDDDTGDNIYKSGDDLNFVNDINYINNVS